MEEKNTGTSATVGSEEKIRCEWGRAVASAAIKEMTPKDKDESAFTSEEIDAFIAECKTNGKDAMDVVEHIAKREGVDLAGDEPKDEDKRRLWTFLLQVVKKWVEDFASFAAQDAANGKFKWKELIQDYINDRFGNIFKRDVATGDASDDIGTYPVPQVNDLVLRIPRAVRRRVFTGYPTSLGVDAGCGSRGMPQESLSTPRLLLLLLLGPNAVCLTHSVLPLTGIQLSGSRR